MRACQAYAVIRGRGFVIPDDVKELVVPVLSHRLIMRSLARSVHASEYLQSVVDELTVPTEERL
jgi:MoxR-like ATPase